MKLGFSPCFAILFNAEIVFVIIAKDLRRIICARFNLRSCYYISRGKDEGVKFASSLGISSSSSSSAGTAIIVAIRIRRASRSKAVHESTVSPKFQIIHGSRTKRLLHTLPPSAGTAIIIIREEAENIAPI